MCLEQLWLFIVANSVVPETGLEPALVTQPDPKSGASTNSATPAKELLAAIFPLSCFPANDLWGLDEVPANR